MEEVKNCLTRLLDLFGQNQAEFARQLSVTSNRYVSKQTVNNWKRNGCRIPERYAIHIEALTGGHITAREVLEERDWDRAERNV